MKSIIACILFVLCSLTISAQEQSNGIPLSVAYYNQVLFQPGVKVAAYFNIKELETQQEGATGDYSKSKSLVINPQLAYFASPGIHSSFLANIEFGYKRTKSRRNTFSAWSVGLGYLGQFQVQSVIVNLSDGEKQKVRDLRSYILTTVNYEFGRQINRKLDWYAKISPGYRISLDNASGMVLSAEVGVQFHLFD